MGNNSSVNMAILQKLVHGIDHSYLECIKYDQEVVRYGFVWMDRRHQNYISPTLSGDSMLDLP